jgi:hypothetical protein
MAEAATVAGILSEAGVAAEAIAAPATEVTPGSVAPPGAPAGPEDEVPKTIQFDLPGSNQLTEPHELPASEGESEQPLKDSWWHNDVNDLQQSVHVPTRETVQPAYYRAPGAARRSRPDAQTSPVIRRLPPI